VAARLPSAAAGAAPPADEARFRLWRALTALVREAARATPAGLLVVLDDLHAADRASLGLLQFLARELRSLRVLLLGTYRDVEAHGDAEVGDLIDRIGREGTTLTLPRLDRAASADLVRRRAGEVDAGVVDRIFDGTQGNPLFVEEMVRLLAEQGASAVAEGQVPETVRGVVRRRLERLSPEARDVLELAAVAGDTIDRSLLAAASGHEVATALDEAVRAGVLAAGARRFGHALFREGLYRDLAEARRRELHGRIADALEAGGRASDAELAHHARLGPPELLPRAVEHALRAARRAQDLSAYDEAVLVLEGAREASAAGQPAALLARVLVALGEAHIRRGDPAAGQAAAREASAVAQALDDAALGAEAALTYGRVFTFGVVDPVLVGMLEESLEALPPGDSALRARLLARLAAALQPSLHIDEPVRVAREAIATARRLDDRRALLETMHDAISALMDMVTPAEVRALNLEAEALALELGDRERRLRALLRLAFAHLGLGELVAADGCIAAFETLADELKAPWHAWRGPMLRAMRLAMHGRFADAERLADEARRMGEAARDPLVERVWLSNRDGLLRTAHRHDELLALEPQMRRVRAMFSHGGAWQSLGAALTYSRLEDLDSVRAFLGLFPEGPRVPVGNLFAYFFLAEPVALAGTPTVAAALGEQVRAFPDDYVVLGMTYMGWEGPTSRLHGLLAAAAGRWDEAWPCFEDAIARCRRLDVGPHLARAEYDCARARLAHGAPGDLEVANALLASARATGEKLGMTGLVALIDRRLEASTIAAAPPATIGATRAPSLTLEGEVWTITRGATTFRLKDSLGLRYLARLLEQPGREVHVLDLVGERAGGGANEAIDLGDAGDLLDEEAKAAYRSRLEDLRDVVAEAESFGDDARAARARDEIEALAAELGRAVGLGGRSRRAGAAAERARSAVQRRIKNALERIGEHAPALAEYLTTTVRTGNHCIFRP
ncbi:MAG TPA: hypothetical protein VHJ20_05795, partial [Polyangia bacterium]|nr:hypothetical protein [Polyangia bacterium]